MGESGRAPDGKKSRNFGRRAAADAAGGPVGRPGGVAAAVRPAVEDTVETMEAGGEGVLEREAGEEAGMGVKLVELRAGRSVALAVLLPAGVEALCGAVPQMTPLAFMVSLTGKEMITGASGTSIKPSF